ncbi:MAG: hypothetical protein MUE36_08675 [Acidimicrobiales bacterium]|jgi:hypothetical protein|nr:hypothetical protein [Acidimicrobiales bacterium]
MFGEINWFPRFGDIPGVAYEPIVPVDRSKLKRASERPEVSSFTTDGRVVTYLTWGDDEESSSASPSADHFVDEELDGLKTGTVLRKLAEALELPGVASDYHFALQAFVGVAWKRRREEPEALGLLERVAWLDISFLEAFPSAFTYTRMDETSYYRVSSMQNLLTIYEYEGALLEAIQVARIGLKHEQFEPKKLDELLERQAALEAEFRG